jgi:hypothetical protein
MPFQNDPEHGLTDFDQRKFLYPVTDAVTAAVLIFPPPEPFGTLKRI